MDKEHERLKTHWNYAHEEYTCVDGVRVTCRFETTTADQTSDRTGIDKFHMKELSLDSTDSFDSVELYLN